MIMNNKSVLLSIKPQYANLIVDGIKTIELRRRFPENHSGKCFIYSSSPTQAIIGECFITRVEKLPLNELWSKHSNDSMIGWDDFKKYFSDVEHGYALVLTKYLRYESPIKLKEKVSSGRPPQSYCYLS